MNKAVAGVLVVAIAAAAAFGGYRYAMHRHMHAAPAAQVDAAGAPQADRRVLYWYDPMYPQQKFDKPGKSPFMDMQLVPKYADETADAGTVAISPQIVQNLGVRTAPAEAGSLESRIEAVGAVLYNERGIVQLQARAAGFVERLHARAPLDFVRRGAALVELFYPEWAGAQEEYLLLARLASEEARPLAQAARKRLALLGMTEAEIAELERAGKASGRAIVTSPIAGTIAELGVREGMTVAPGAMLFRIAELGSVWVNAEVPETQAAWVKPGSRAEVRVAAYPDAMFPGRVSAILPEVHPTTRTLRARIELANPGMRLKPGMFATVVFAGERQRESVLVPSEAVIRTGSRSVVILAEPQGRFRVVDVEVGMESASRAEIRKGLRAGDLVVLSGQFLIDSEASLTATVGRIAAPPNEPASAEGLHKGRGTVTAIDAAAGRLEVDHEPMPSIKWPRMTMEFIAADKAELAPLKKGDRIEFEMRGKPDKEGSYTIERIRPDARK